jgi:hypothetical protein
LINDNVRLRIHTDNSKTILIFQPNKCTTYFFTTPYQQIIGMGRDALPFILKELKQTRGHWLWALFAITGEYHAPDGSTFDEAVDAWLDWGRKQRLLN